MIYIHVPFCRSFCTYCDFYSEAVPKCRRNEVALGQDALFEQFSSALTAEIMSEKNEISGYVNTLYIGGGTPSVLPLSFFESVVGALSRAGHPGPFDEFTVEVNPEDVVEKGPAYIEGLIKLGVNRISMGVQSFDDGILKWMNRRHDSETARRAYSIIEQAGVKNISIDLIFGLPQLDAYNWEKTVRQALSISPSGNRPSHVSAYQLSVEPGSMLAEQVRQGRFAEADQEHCREQYDILCRVLSQEGYHHYEISNFALPGREAVHNSAYWAHIPYIGFGPGAHSFIIRDDGTGLRQMIRRWNLPDLKAYLSSTSPAAVRESETLDTEQYDLETIMLSLRTDSGVQEQFLRTHADEKAVDRMLLNGALVRIDGGRIRIPEESFFISDGIVAEIV